MDAVIAWRAWQQEQNVATRSEGLHLDQNPFDKPRLDCVQGMVPLIRVTDVSGGLEVVPGSHEGASKADFKHRYGKCCDES